LVARANRQTRRSIWRSMIEWIFFHVCKSPDKSNQISSNEVKQSSNRIVLRSPYLTVLLCL
jgi:hypothetical protein